MFYKAPFTYQMGSLMDNISFNDRYIIIGHRWEIPLYNLPEESSSNNH